MQANIKDILRELYYDLEHGNEQEVKQANNMIDKLLGEKFNISPLTLFIYNIRKKDCIQNINKLLLGEDIKDFDIAKALSSLITHLIIASEKDMRKFHHLRINEIIHLLDQFVAGVIDRPEIILFFNEIM